MGKTIHQSMYVCYVPHCPKCRKWGTLRANWTANRNTLNWCGPYFQIQHYHQEVFPVLLGAVRETGLTHSEASRRPYAITRHDGYCYFGRVYPGPEDISDVPPVPPEREMIVR